MNKYDEALEMIKRHGEVIYSFNEPIPVIKAVPYNVATDRKVLLAIHWTLCDNPSAIHLEYSEKIKEIMKDKTTGGGESISVKDILDAVEKWNYHDEPLYEDEDCPVCNGEGEVEWQFDHYSKTDDCPECEGDGFLNRRKIGTMPKVVDDSVIYIKGKPFGPETMISFAGLLQHLGVEKIHLDGFVRDRNVQFTLEEGVYFYMWMLNISHKSDEKLIEVVAPPF